MFKQITREEYLLLADAGVKVSAWLDTDHFKENNANPRYRDDLTYDPYLVEDIRYGNGEWQEFYAWVDDEGAGDVQPIT